MMIECPYCGNKIKSKGEIIESNTDECIIEFTCARCEMDFSLRYEAIKYGKV